MIVLECANCGKQYPSDFRKQWGKTKETNGYGPTMQCVAIVPAEGAPPAPDGSTPGEVCGGSLAAIDKSAAKITEARESGVLSELTPN